MVRSACRDKHPSTVSVAHAVGTVTCALEKKCDLASLDQRSACPTGGRATGVGSPFPHPFIAFYRIFIAFYREISRNIAATILPEALARAGMP